MIDIDEIISRAKKRNEETINDMKSLIEDEEFMSKIKIYGEKHNFDAVELFRKYYEELKDTQNNDFGFLKKITNDLENIDEKEQSS